MMRRIKKIPKLIHKSNEILKTEGLARLSDRSRRFLYFKVFPERKKKIFKDILFIDGCTLPHPSRYRVEHQMEQLQSAGMFVDRVFYDQLTMDMLQYYRGFVFFRCPATDMVRSFIEAAKHTNKTCFFDIDDLVIDTKYTDMIGYVAGMSKADKLHYDDGVKRMKETLSLCDYALTTTEALARELKQYTVKKEVFINRNSASDEMIYTSEQALKTVSSKSNHDPIVIGYFSGSITHNEDFQMVMPALKHILRKHKNVHLKVAGILDIPDELGVYAERISSIGFVDWKKLPMSIAGCDINIAPLTKTIFNEAKSENKWTEAALVKVPTIASDIGAFKTVIENNKTGFLANSVDDWKSILEKLVTDKELRDTVGLAAYKSVRANHTTISSAHVLAQFISDRLARNIAFILPSTDISGGVNVILKHAEILRSNGADVILIDAISKTAYKKSIKAYDYRHTINDFNTLMRSKTKFEGHIDTVIATLWSTVSVAMKYTNIKRRMYLVQNFETDFYEPGAGGLRFNANATYCDNTGLEYITISKWCQDWLKANYGKQSRYVSNGIDGRLYPERKRDFTKKIKLLIEGDSQSEYKNTDEAFRIVQKLDPKRFEVAYLSYRKEPKDWYRVDTFYNRIAPEKVGEVYASCDILIKTSILESFSYPPLEMMATGGVSVVLPNGGNVEYLKNGYNCLFYEQGDIDDGVSKVIELVKNNKLRDKLISNGLKTARAYDWSKIEQDVVRLYE